MSLANVVATLAVHGGYHAVTVDDTVYIFHNAAHAETFAALRDETGLANARLFFAHCEASGEAFQG